MLVDLGFDGCRCCDDVVVVVAVDVRREQHPVVFGGLGCGSGVCQAGCDFFNDVLHGC